MEHELQAGRIVSPDFAPLGMRGKMAWEKLDGLGLFGEPGNALEHAPRGRRLLRGAANRGRPTERGISRGNTDTSAVFLCVSRTYSGLKRTADGLQTLW